MEAIIDKEMMKVYNMTDEQLLEHIRGLEMLEMLLIREMEMVVDVLELKQKNNKKKKTE